MSNTVQKQDLKQIGNYLYEIPKTFRPDMKVPARFYSTPGFIEKLLEERAIEQLINTATLDGVYKYVVAMADIHEGYGFPIGGVVAVDKTRGVISPGGVGYDINCGVRLLKTGLTVEELNARKIDLMEEIFKTVPAGLASKSAVKISFEELDKFLEGGAEYAAQKGFGTVKDLENIEENGRLRIADSGKVSDRAKKRGRDQLGTLGSGNHFLEIQRVTDIFDKEVADKLNIQQDEVFVMIHTGSRGLGHQVASDYIEIMRAAMKKYNIKVPDPELVSAPFNSEEGQDYFKAMAAAANFAWANRQIIMEKTRRAFNRTLRIPKEQIYLIYDVAHNIAKVEGNLIVHRKGATRAFGPGNSNIPPVYRDIGQPVIIPGSMGTASYLMLGTKKAEEETFGSAAHGAGRALSRHKAKRIVRGEELRTELEKEGIAVFSTSNVGLAEEAPVAYKNIDEVANITAETGIAKKVVRLKPIGVVKG
ncbi:MAG: RtcB family protein [Firmicutes bacterium]|nr:RtcB family protein [Bacillota bacterium]